MTTNIQLDQMTKHMHVPYFRSVFMRNALPISGVHRNESGIVNLDDARGPSSLGSICKERQSHDIFR